jgi:prepilin-type N-terminal cleavage/methylation domain-containing protein
MTRSLPRAPRWAFTLIEMLVVIALILILLTIAAAMFPRFAENHRIVKGADQLQGWLLNAKQRALRDRLPTGVRFLIEQGVVKEMLYVQQVEDYTAGRFVALQQPFTDPRGFVCNFQGVDFRGPGLRDDAPENWTVQAGDYLEFFGGGLVREIWWVPDATRVYIPPTSTPPPQTPPTGTSSYRIIRQPRPVAGESPLTLPQNIVIDPRPIRSQDVPLRRVYFAGQAGSPTNNPRPAREFAEILFAPGGGVVGKGTTSRENIILWVRDVTKDDSPLESAPLLVSIHIRTGLISVHPVDPTSGNQFLPPDPRCTWFNFTRDGRSSGL